MRLTRIEANNLKGKPFAYDLSPAVAIIGPNFAGKTRVIDAIRLALLGYLPELGKTNRATWGLASGSEMEIHGVIMVGDNPRTESEYIMDRDIQFARRYWLERETVKDTLSCNPDFNFAQFAANPMFNASLYFSMTERERTNYVFSVVGTANLADVIDSTIDGLKLTYSTANKRQKDTIGAVRVLTELKNRENDIGLQTPTDKEIAAAQAELDEAQQKVGALRQRADAARDYQERQSKLPSSSPNNTWSGEIDKAKKLIEEAKAALVPEPENIEQAVKDKQRFYDISLHDRMTLADQLKELNKKSESFSRLKECPICGTKGKNWRDTVSNKLASQIKATADNLSNLDDRITATKKELDDLDAAHVAGNRVRIKNAAHRENIEKWTEQLKELKQRQVKWNEQLGKLKAELTTLPKAEMPSDDETLAVTRAAREARMKFDNLVDLRAQYENYQHDLKRAAQAAQEHHDAKARLAVTKAVLEAMQTIKAEVVEAAFGGLLKVANMIVGKVLKTPLAFHEGEVGRWDGAKFIGHGTFSGTEKALTFVAIATALAQQSPLRILIFDELGRLDYARQHDVTFLLKEALDKGLIDQFIIVGALQRKDVPLASELQIIELE